LRSEERNTLGARHPLSRWPGRGRTRSDGKGAGPTRLPSWLRYGVAVLAVGATLGLKLLLDSLIEAQTPFLLLAGAVVVGAWFGGLGPGILATVLGALGADYFFLPPEGSFTGLGLAFLPLLLFTLQGILIASLFEALRLARRRAEASTLEGARLNGELSEHKLRLQQLVGQLVAAQEEERRRVAYEVHDGLAQTVTAAYQHLQTYAADNPPGSARGQEELDEALRMLRRTVGEARAVVADLRPTVLDDFGLARALRLQVERLSGEGLRATFEDDLGGERLPEAVETALFRVAQEALTNARKHSGAQEVHVALGRRGQALRLEVRDWGRGFAADGSDGAKGEAEPGERVGLASMQERVALLGGRLEIQSEPGAGTAVVAEVPLPEGWATEGEDDDG
jgi:signal transduction histidine kinase